MVVPRKHMPVPGGVRGCNLIAIKMVLIEISNHDVRSFFRSLSLSELSSGVAVANDTLSVWFRHHAARE